MLSRHPHGLFPLFFTEMWERFSFYCMMGLLTLYMDAPEEKGGLGFDEGLSSQIYGMYKGLLYFTPLFGGLLADRLWGYTRTIFAGGIAMMAGHLALAGEGLTFFFMGLACLIVGNGMFKPNISAMVGNLYHDKPDLKDQGYSIFYMGINIGAFIAPLTANFLKNELGWHYAFGAASIGMALSLVIFWACRNLLGEAERKTPLIVLSPSVNGDEGQGGPEPNERLRYQAPLHYLWRRCPILDGLQSEWRDVDSLGSRPHVAVSWHRLSEQRGNDCIAINPFLVIMLTPVLVLFFNWLKRIGLEVSTPKKMVMGMLLTAGCFLVMALGGLAGGDTGRVPVFWLFGGYLLVTLGELCLSPMGLSVVSKLAPKRHAGIFMGGWFVATVPEPTWREPLVSCGKAGITRHSFSCWWAHRWGPPRF